MKKKTYEPKLFLFTANSLIFRIKTIILFAKKKLAKEFIILYLIKHIIL